MPTWNKPTPPEPTHRLTNAETLGAAIARLWSGLLSRKDRFVARRVVANALATNVYAYRGTRLDLTPIEDADERYRIVRTQLEIDGLRTVLDTDAAHGYTDAFGELGRGFSVSDSPILSGPTTMEEWKQVKDELEPQVTTRENKDEMIGRAWKRAAERPQHEYVEPTPEAVSGGLDEDERARLFGWGDRTAPATQEEAFSEAFPALTPLVEVLAEVGYGVRRLDEPRKCCGGACGDLAGHTSDSYGLDSDSYVQAEDGTSHRAQSIDLDDDAPAEIDADMNDILLAVALKEAFGTPSAPRRIDAAAPPQTGSIRRIG